jgi:hypothetical protein
VFLAVRQITDDPLRLEVGGTKFEIDLGAQQQCETKKKLQLRLKLF